MSFKKIEEMSTKDMVDEYNRLTGKNIKKFSTRAAGEKQLSSARAAVKGDYFSPEETIEKPKATRSEGTKNSWGNPEVSAKRSKKQRVIVATLSGDVEYRSVRAAFIDLGLPISKHIKFRADLKEKGRLPFSSGSLVYNFKIVDVEK